MDESTGIFTFLIILIVQLGLIVAIVASLWKIFTKAGQPGWAAIVPIYNIIVMIQISGKPLWYIALFLIPFVNFVAPFLILIPLAQRFGKDMIFGIGMAFLPFIFLPLLAFSDATYQPLPDSTVTV